MSKEILAGIQLGFSLSPAAHDNGCARLPLCDVNTLGAGQQQLRSSSYFSSTRNGADLLG